MTTIEDIDAWASVLTGENREGGYYYVTEPVKLLEWKLKHLKGQLIGLTGLQGTGKTSALWYLKSKFSYRKERKWVEDSAFIKWTKDWMEKMIHNEASDTVTNQIIGEIENVFRAYGKNFRKHPFLRRVPNVSDIKEETIKNLLFSIDFRADLILGKRRVKEIEQEAVMEYLAQRKVIFIDFQDYTKTDRRLMTRDLSEFQNFWGRLSKYEERNTNIVLAIQKELFTGHFLFGKMSVIELQPLKPEELMHVFKTQFPECDLIVDDALILLGELSRGVFRRFLKYLSLTLETFAISDEKPPMSVDHVNKAVTVEQLIKDMELELCNIFKNPYQRRQAVELLNHLREEGRANQNDIAEFLNVSMSTAGKMVTKLYAYGYVTKKRGTGREWIVSLKR